MNSLFFRASEIIQQLYERNLMSWDELDREVVLTMQALIIEQKRLEFNAGEKK